MLILETIARIRRAFFVQGKSISPAVARIGRSCWRSARHDDLTYVAGRRRNFASLAALATELAAQHGNRYEPAPSAWERDYGSWYEARLARTASGAMSAS
jgi:hypothetical protein